MTDRSNWKENPLVQIRFQRISPMDIRRRLEKYYTYVRHARSPKAIDVSCLFLYIVRNMMYDGDNLRYSRRDIMRMLSIGYNRRYDQLIKRHEQRILESEVYYERFLLLIRDLDKQEQQRKKKIDESINIQREGEGLSAN
jgi:hypothetical protein